MNDEVKATEKSDDRFTIKQTKDGWKGIVQVAGVYRKVVFGKTKKEVEDKIKEILEG
jgi:phosphotransferase system IIB component